MADAALRVGVAGLGIMGAGMAADAFALAFLIPNLFRRLFGEGAFSQGFVPLFARRLDGKGGMDEAKRFAEEVQAVFLPLLILVTVVFMIAMPAFVVRIQYQRDFWENSSAM